MAAVKWGSSPATTSYLTTDLNSLANDGNKLGAAIDNSTSLHMYIDVDFDLALQGTARTAGAHIAVFLIPAVDGTNYASGDDSFDPPANRFVAALSLDAAVTARRVAAQMIPVPPGLFKLLFENKTGQAFAASGNVAAYRLYSVSVA